MSVTTLTLRTLAILSVVLAISDAHCQGFTPTRFTVVAEGTAGAPVILLLPGLTSGREVFNSEAALLAPTCRLLRVQLNGFAGAPAGPNASGPLLLPIVEELHQYLLANHLHPAVIGHSLGGLLTLMLAQAHPEDVQKLLIVDALPFYPLVFSREATVDMVRPQAQAMHDQLLKQTPEETNAAAAKTAATLVNNPAGQKIVTANSIASDRNVFATAMLEDLTTDLRPSLKQITTPATVLYPYDPSFQGADPTPIDALYHGAYANMPNVKLRRIDNSRHFSSSTSQMTSTSPSNPFLGSPQLPRRR